MRTGFIVVSIFAALFGVFGRSMAQGTAAPSIDAFYSSAVESMRSLPQPQYLTYSMEGEGDGLEIELRVIDHLVWLEMTTDRKSVV